MVNLASVILVTGIGLAIFFREDIGAFLNSFKGFGTVNVEAPDLQAPEGGIAQGFLDLLGGAGTGESVFQAGQEAGVATSKAIQEAQVSIGEAGQQITTQLNQAGLATQEAVGGVATETTKIFTDPAQSVLAPVFQAGQETQKITSQIGESIFEAGQESRVEFDKAVEDTTKFFEDISSSFISLFGGQQEQKQILDIESATTEKQATNILGTSLINPESLTGGFLATIESPTRGEIRFN